MIRRFAFPLSIVLCLLTGTSVLPDTFSGPCATEQARWANAFQALQAEMEVYHQTKMESVTPRIARQMEAHERGMSIARVVETVIKERGERLAEFGRRCLELADAERSSFEEWRSCATMGARKRDSAAVAAFKTISLDRERVKAELQELLLDEAYIQYKNYRAPAPPASPSYEANQPWSIGYR